MRLWRPVVGVLLTLCFCAPAHAAGLVAEKAFPGAMAYVNGGSAASPNGWAIVGWSEQVNSTTFQVEVSTRPPGGDWSAPVAMGTSTDHMMVGIEVAINDSGAAAATWVEFINGQGGSNIVYVSSRAPDGNFTAPETFPGESTSDVGVDSAGNVDLLYWLEGVSPDAGPYVKTFSAGGQAAGASTHRLGSNGCYPIALTTGPEGTALAAYSCGGLSFAIRHNGTWTDSSPFTNNVIQCPNMGTSTAYNLGALAVSNQGLPVALVQRTDSTHDCNFPGFDQAKNTLILVTQSGGAMAAGGTVVEGPMGQYGGEGDVGGGSIGIGGGQVVVAWMQRDKNLRSFPMLRTFANNGASAPGPVEAIPGALPGAYTKLGVSDDGTALVGWTGYDQAAGTSTPYLSVRPPVGPPGAPVSFGAGSPNGGLANVSVTSSGDGLLSWIEGDTHTSAMHARGWDQTPPTLSNVSIPASGTTGTPIAFGAQATDLWGPVTLGWDFGDGTSDSGGAPTHAFGPDGVHTVTVTATDAAGNSSSQSAPIALTPVTLALEPRPPFFSSLSLSAKTFRVGKASTAVTAKVRKKRVATGTKIRFTLSKAASVAIKIERALPGRRRGTRCLAPTKKLKRARKCTRWTTAGTLTRQAAAGANVVAFSGRIGKKALRPGTYRMTLIPSADGLTGPAKTVAFKIVR